MLYNYFSTVGIISLQFSFFISGGDITPTIDLVKNSDIAKIPDGGDFMSCNCNNNNNNNNTNEQCKPPIPPHGYWIPGCPPPPPYPPYPYDCPPVNPNGSSIEAQIAKLAKKASIIRKMIDNLKNKNKSIQISIGCGASYNFGTYTNSEGEVTDYGKKVLEILDEELEAIKTKLTELSGELEVQDIATSGTETTVKQ